MIRKLSLAALVVVASSFAASRLAAATVNVTPSNMGIWTLNSFDDNGNIVTNGPYYGTAAMAPGPATPPIGTGSAHLATPVGAADGAAAIATEGYDGTLLSSITSLSYSAYDVTNNGQQFPYLAISIDEYGPTDTTDVDTLFFEPPYQQPSTGNPALANQGPTVQNVWQNWNAFVGGWWDNNNIGSPGTFEGPGEPGVQPLSAFLAQYPLATIANGGYPGLGGIALQVGFESSGDTEDGYVDAFSIGVGGVTTTYNFDPNPVPEPSTIVLIVLGGLVLCPFALRRRRASAA